MDPNILAGAAAVAGFVAGLLIGRSKKDPAAEKLAAAEAELRLIKEAPKTAEQRVERFGLLWFPLFTLKEPHILDVKVGLPHCPKCVVALKLREDGWVCLDCAGRHPASVADTQVMDQIKADAVEAYCKRNKGWRLKDSSPA